MTYKTKGVCCNEINFDIRDNKITEVNFASGCDGNLKGISRLVKGMNVEDVIQRVSGVHCRDRGTSCPDQLAQALRQWQKQS